MPDKRIMNVAEAIREATDTCMERDDRVFLMGEGVADPAAIFGTTRGLADKYGANRVIEMPVAENGFTGVAIGAAMMGRRPIIIHQRVDFSLLSLEQLFDNAAKTCYVTRGQHTVPLVVRMIIGRGWGQGPAHSQSLESIFAHVPGLKVVMPSSPRLSKGMMIAAIEDPNPVLMLEHRWVHYVEGDTPEGYYTVPLEGTTKVRDGGHVTIVANSYMRYEASEAAAALAEVGVEVDIHDLTVLRPLNVDAIVESVSKTGHLLVVDSGWMQHGIGSEVITRVVEQNLTALKAAPRRLGLSDHPTPSSRELAKDYYPRAFDIADSVADMLDLPDDKRDQVTTMINKARGSLPADIPNPAFRGPF
ncbi:MAG: alpha-ketoacid dehydrogenase subunit beta [Rhodospirillaceae bacterium]|jgi:acetoin:2,6-dichlorophenolindophenol oxidoreductase subunit beta|nr:alpha-ketoacid dehydrogenase subunit beta [Rhodospirillaceae bacterium]MBT4220540.1 alpha-ketoacid dehydrogenase subunit beta [Rhodospirillaceae bacterium]MBT4464083.1 alpha-ketoacid dehydrogenase subunit beta [Rhodospirillaceae bacterium]MBT5309513.1 alpha-ketoacid dehydrogenase subunit beta [Rhodospirillaceae bacterium]MBT7355340.1 alpha-ketoacid dehydrogenase subunit beta [Rhodospirillaceae bacterium]